MLQLHPPAPSGCQMLAANHPTEVLCVHLRCLAGLLLIVQVYVGRPLTKAPPFAAAAESCWALERLPVQVVLERVLWTPCRGWDAHELLLAAGHWQYAQREG